MGESPPPEGPATGCGAAPRPTADAVPAVRRDADADGESRHARRLTHDPRLHHLPSSAARPGQAAETAGHSRGCRGHHRRRSAGVPAGRMTPARSEPGPAAQGARSIPPSKSFLKKFDLFPKGISLEIPDSGLAGDELAVVAEEDGAVVAGLQFGGADVATKGEVVADE